MGLINAKEASCFQFLCPYVTQLDKYRNSIIIRANSLWKIAAFLRLPADWPWYNKNHKQDKMLSFFLSPYSLNLWLWYKKSLSQQSIVCGKEGRINTFLPNGRTLSWKPEATPSLACSLDLHGKASLPHPNYCIHTWQNHCVLTWTVCWVIEESSLIRCTGRATTQGTTQNPFWKEKMGQKNHQPLQNGTSSYTTQSKIIHQVYNLLAFPGLKTPHNANQSR